jgi:hypothetical protein
MYFLRIFHELRLLKSAPLEVSYIVLRLVRHRQMDTVTPQKWDEILSPGGDFDEFF